MMEYPEFKVCCRCFTFNQSKYITDTMNGFTMQQTSFPFVCTIVDDASTDGEQEVIRKYVEDNFDFSEGSVAYNKETDYAYVTYAQHETNKNCYFVVLYLKENHYSQRKPKMGYLSEWRDMCEYEAPCEGDDYWIDKDKLQKQVGVMDNNSQIGLVYTSVYAKKCDKVIYNISSNKCSFEELLQNNIIANLSTMYKVKLSETYQNEISPQNRRWLMGDLPFWLYLSIKSNIFFLRDYTAIYRVLDESASHFTSLDKQIAFNTSEYEIKCFFIDHFFSNTAYYDLYNKYSSNKLIESNIYAFINFNNSKKALYFLFSKSETLCLRIRIKVLCYWIKKILKNII